MLTGRMAPVEEVVLTMTAAPVDEVALRGRMEAPVDAAAPVEEAVRLTAGEAEEGATAAEDGEEAAGRALDEEPRAAAAVEEAVELPGSTGDGPLDDVV